MATVLLLRFPFGRFHANPWARHVNEGAVEIPPSPWRLLRALYSVWRTRAPELDAGVVHEVLAQLATPPAFHVPRHTISHTRHYYPDSRDGTDRTLDAFAVVAPDAELAIEWTATDLGVDGWAVLERLAASMPYFGRADSLCEARVVQRWQPSEHETWQPLCAAQDVTPGATATAVLAPEVPLDVETLLARPVDVRRGGLLFPTGSRFVGYQRCGELSPLPGRRAASQLAPTAVRFDALQAALPSETDTVVYADLLRQGALSKLDADRSDRLHTMLGGRTADGAPMTSDHGHAHYLPILRERRIAGLLVWVPDGLPTVELDALTRLTTLRSSWEKDWRLEVRVAGHGAVEQIAPELIGPARVWRSVTPFVPARYPKRRTEPREDYVGREVARDLRDRGLPMPVSVELVPGRDEREFVRHRPSRRATRVGRLASFLRLTFASEVGGPIAVGHLSHFGLGLFEPER